LSKHDMGSGLASKLASDLILALNLENWNHLERKKNIKC
jgi:hypothetical protein